MRKMKLVMIGNGMAGVRTLEELIRIAPGLYDITVFGAEPHPNYNRILLSPVLAGEQTLDEIVLNPLSWYAQHDITLHLGKPVVRIDRVRRVVHAADGTQAAYDRLLVATGSSPFILPVPGRELEGVIGYRDIADTQAMIDAATKYEHAVVIGGGLLGLEAANGLALRGMTVTVVHIADWLMERQLDDVAGGLLRDSLRLRRRRVRRAPRHRLRPGRAAVRAGQCLRHPPRDGGHRPLRRQPGVDQAEGDRHRPVLGRRLHGRRGLRRDRAVRPARRRLQEARDP
jgi:nitrite reductase (NADH) large subunit